MALTMNPERLNAAVAKAFAPPLRAELIRIDHVKRWRWPLAYKTVVERVKVGEFTDFGFDKWMIYHGPRIERIDSICIYRYNEHLLEYFFGGQCLCEGDGISYPMPTLSQG